MSKNKTKQSSDRKKHNARFRFRREVARVTAAYLKESPYASSVLQSDEIFSVWGLPISR